MKNRTLHLIEPTFDFRSINNTSVLLTSVNALINLDEYHTSLGDMNPSDIIAVAEHFHTINFVTTQFDQSSDIYKETVILLNYFSWFKNVTNFIPNPAVSFEYVLPHHRPDNPVLWVFGCSHSYGVGLRPNEKTFGKIAAELLNLPLISISKPGSSLNWSTINLMSADIRPGDTVIWQITSPDRIPQFNGHTVKEVILARTDNRYLLEVFDANQVFFNQINLLNFGVKYLRSHNIKFVMISISPKVEKHYEYITEYVKYPEYCYTPECGLDFGTDQQHLGPLSHQAIAQHILNHVQCLYD
jgi:hypothetical protein